LITTRSYKDNIDHKINYAFTNVKLEDMEM